MLQYIDTLKYLYAEHNFQPFFIKSFEEKDFVDSLLTILGKADEHGLNPVRYHFTLIKNEFDKSTRDGSETGGAARS